MHLPLSHWLLLIYALSVWQMLTESLLHMEPCSKSGRRNPKLPLLFSPIETRLQWKQCFKQLWIMNLNQFNNPSKGVFAFCSLSLVAIGSTHFSVAYLFSNELWKRSKGERGRECSCRRFPLGIRSLLDLMPPDIFHIVFSALLQDTSFSENDGTYWLPGTILAAVAVGHG